MDVICLGEPLVGFYGTSGQSLEDDMAFARTFGGDTSNVALALAKLGLQAAYVTRVGNDPFGRRFLRLWRSHGVDTTQVVIDPTFPTGIYFSASSDTQHDFVYYRKGSAASRMTPDSIDAGFISQAKVLHVSGISQAISPSCSEAVQYALHVAQQNGVLVSYDVNHRPSLWSEARARAMVRATVYGFVDLLEASPEELELLTGIQEPEEAAAALLEAGVSWVAVKRGSDGCYLASAEGAVSVPAFPVEVVDTVGAGDAFDAGLIAARIEGMPLEQAARFASAVAALTCRGVGSVAAQPTREEVIHLLEQ